MNMSHSIKGNLMKSGFKTNQKRLCYCASSDVEPKMLSNPKKGWNNL